MSLDPDPKKRIPSNVWIEAAPVIDLCIAEIPSLAKLGRDTIAEMLVEKYRSGRN